MHPADRLRQTVAGYRLEVLWAAIADERGERQTLDGTRLNTPQ